jgi:N6-L-threonylcarbamoyladenine synthase
MSLYVLGIESTAHTFAVAIVNDDYKILADERAVYKPIGATGIDPHNAAEHHSQVAPTVFKKVFEESGLSVKSISAIAYSMGPGLGPALRIGATIARVLSYKYNIPLYPVHHAIGHIELVKTFFSLKNPLIVLVSGGHTTITGFAGGRWRVYGETLDITLGNLLDMFAREIGIGFPGGPRIEEIAERGMNFIEMPYTVKGNNLQFSGLLTYALKLVKEGYKIEDIAYSLQETAFSMLTEATERAMIQLNVDSIALTGGVASNDRLYSMIRGMAEEHDLPVYRLEKKFNSDNGVQIAIVGVKMLRSKAPSIKVENAIVRQRWRLDEVDIIWS